MSQTDRPPSLVIAIYFLQIKLKKKQQQKKKNKKKKNNDKNNKSNVVNKRLYELSKNKKKVLTDAEF